MKFPISPEGRAELDHRRQSLAKMFEMTDLDLAQALVDLTTEAREERPELKPTTEVYDSNFLWHVVPEVVRRLCSLDKREIGGRQMRHPVGMMRKLAPLEFRRLTGLYLRNLQGQHRMRAWNLLTNEPCNGNPIVFALDRLAPGSLHDKEDWIVQSVAEIARHREKQFTGVWTPALLNNPF